MTKCKKPQINTPRGEPFMFNLRYCNLQKGSNNAQNIKAHWCGFFGDMIPRFVRGWGITHFSVTSQKNFPFFISRFFIIFIFSPFSKLLNAIISGRKMREKKMKKTNTNKAKFDVKLTGIFFPFLFFFLVCFSEE